MLRKNNGYFHYFFLTFYRDRGDDADRQKWFVRIAHMVFSDGGRYHPIRIVKNRSKRLYSRLNGIYDFWHIVND